uniref:RING-type E3 ubiquitin transferase n=1 Tax=Kalanchoe fedtschenkoi TaxID=63787 RepID=A0A7N0UZL6_KALFE
MTTTTTTQIPDDFKCPISLEIMSDPVILSSGHTFDRASIQRWLDAGHRTCPITKLPLPDRPSLIPNHVLRSLISNYASVAPESHRCQTLELEPKGLVSVLGSRGASAEVKVEALGQLGKMSKRDATFRRRLTESGAVAAVLRCVESDDLKLQEKALHLLLNLSLDDDNKVGLVAEGAIGRVVAALRGGSSDGRAVAATVLTSLAVVEVNKATIGAYPHAIPSLVSLLCEGKLREKKEAATSLYALCSYPENRKRAVECGAVKMLLRIADLGLERAVEVLSLLAKCREGREEMIRFDGCVDILIRVLKMGGPRGVQYALLTLHSLCCCSKRLCTDLRERGVVEYCYGLSEDENEKIRRNADALIQLLQGN